MLDRRSGASRALVGICAAAVRQHRGETDGGEPGGFVAGVNGGWVWAGVLPRPQKRQREWELACGSGSRLWFRPAPDAYGEFPFGGTKCRSAWGWGARLTDDCVSASDHAGAPATTWKPPFGHLTTGRRSGALLSRAILPLGDTRREGSHPDGWGSCRRGPAGRCADRRSAFPCLRAALPTGAILVLGVFPFRQDWKNNGSELCSLPA